jgi:hypothetical protein
MSAKTSKTTKAAKEAPLSLTFRSISITEATDYLLELDRLAHVFPAIGRDDILAAITAVTTACERLHIGDMHRLMTNTSDVLKHVTGLESITSYLKTAQADPLHRLRNVIGALGAAASLAVGADLAAVQQVLPNLKTRTVQPNRPLVDDEILLCRIDMWAVGQSTAPTAIKAAAMYVICESGAMPAESTTVCVDVVDDPQQPRGFLVAGNRLLDCRILHLSDFGVPIFTTCVTAELQTLARAGKDTPLARAIPLTYRGIHTPGGPEATASAQGIIDRLLKRWGLKKDDVTAASLPLWAADATYRQHGLRAAAKVSGRDPERTAQLLNLRLDPIITTPTVTSFLDG